MVTPAAAGAAFQQDQRVNALTHQFGTDEFATANAFGNAFVGSTVRSELQSAVDSSVADGSISWLLEMPGLTDLSGTDSSPFSVGMSNGTPQATVGNPSTYDGTSDLDWWYEPSAADIGPDGSAIHQLPAMFTGGAFSAGPGPIRLNMVLLGEPSSVSMTNTRIRAVSGPTSAPLESTNGFPPGHLPDENVPDSLTSFESMSAGQLAGDMSAGSLADTPIPPSLVGAGLFSCSQAYTATNSVLDVLVGGCTIFTITQIASTQPDRATVAGDVYRFTTNSTTKRVNGCTRNGQPALLADCLAEAAYSSYFHFTTDRVIVLPVEPSPPPGPEPQPQPDPEPEPQPQPQPEPAPQPQPQPVPEPDAGEYPRTLSLSYSAKREKFKGRLTSGSPACVTQQRASVYEKKKGRDPKLGSATTNEKGSFSLRKKNAQGKFYASVKQASTPEGTCLAARSKTVRIG